MSLGFCGKGLLVATLIFTVGSSVPLFQNNYRKSTPAGGTARFVDAGPVFSISDSSSQHFLFQPDNALNCDADGACSAAVEKPRAATQAPTPAKAFSPDNIDNPNEFLKDSKIDNVFNRELILSGIQDWIPSIRKKARHSHSHEAGRLTSPRTGGILLVPGVAGSGLYLSLENATLPSCSRSPLSQPFHRLWAPLFQMFPPLSRQKCLVEKLRLDYSCPPGTTVSEEKLASSGTSMELRRGNLRGSEKVIETSILSDFWEWLLSWFVQVAGSNIPKPDCRDAKTNTFFEAMYHDFPGATVEPQDPGGVRGFDYLDYIENYGVFGTAYFHEIISMLRANGFDGDHLMGFPYDWRRPFWQIDTQPMKDSIESFYRSSNGEKVAIVAHSLGAVITNRFLNSQTQEWKDTHIAAFVPIAGAFGGSFKAMRCVLSGYREISVLDLMGVVNVTLIPPLVLREAYRSFGSLYALAPNPTVWDPSATIIKVANSSVQKAPVTLSDPERASEFIKSQYSLKANAQRWDRNKESIEEGLIVTNSGANIGFVNTYNLSNWWQLLPTGSGDITVSSLQQKARQAHRKLEQESSKILSDPRVPVYCLWADLGFLGTETGFVYRTPNIDIPPVYALGAGDGTLPRKSASLCRDWNSTIVAKQFDGQEHMSILLSRELTAFLSTILKTVFPRTDPIFETSDLGYSNQPFDPIFVVQ